MIRVFKYIVFVFFFFLKRTVIDYSLCQLLVEQEEMGLICNGRVVG